MNSSETKPITDRRNARQCRPLSNVVKLNPVMIDAYCTYSNHINSGVSGPNLTKFLQNVEKSLPFNLSEIEIGILPVYHS